MFAELITRLLKRDDLTTDEAAAAMDLVMRGEAHPAQVAGFLIGLAMKGEKPHELVGLPSEGLLVLHRAGLHSARARPEEGKSSSPADA